MSSSPTHSSYTHMPVGGRARTHTHRAIILLYPCSCFILYVADTSPSPTHLTKSRILTLTEMIVLFSVSRVLYRSYRYKNASNCIRACCTCIFLPVHNLHQGQRLSSGAWHLAQSCLTKFSILRVCSISMWQIKNDYRKLCAIFIKHQSRISLCEMILFILEIVQLSPISISPKSLSLKM